MDRINSLNHVDIGGGRRGFRNKNKLAGIDGTRVVAEWLNGLQEEVIAVIEKSGIDPSAENWLQLTEAIRSQVLNFLVAGGTANALTLGPNPALLAYVAGLPLRIAATATNTGAVTLAVSGLPAKAIVRPNGAALVAGDITAGDVFSAVYDGAAFRLTAPTRSDLRAAATAPVTIVKLTAAGAYSWTVPGGVTSVLVRAWGGGGGGGYNNVYVAAAPSGGAGGGFCERRFVVVPGASITGSVGAGGSGGANMPAQPGQPGLATTVTVAGVTMSAGGGGGGLNTSAANEIASVGNPGSNSGADWDIKGSWGQLGAVMNPSGSFNEALGGGGGSSPLGGGASVGGRGTPGPGLVPGGGGGATSDPTKAGGTGGRGEVHIIYVTP